MNWLRTRLVTVGLAGALLAAGMQLAPGAASAHIGRCRSDPAIILSNGAVLDLSANISDDLSDVQSVQYVVDGPRWTFPIAVISTDGLMGLDEHFHYYAVDPAGTYDTYTTVYTGASGVPVSSGFTTVSLSTLGLLSANGYDGQSLHIHAAPLLKLLAWL